MPNSSSLGPNQQPDLFGQHGAAVGPNGLSYSENFLTCGEEVALLAQLTEMSVSPFRFQGWLGKRQTASFGWHYDFDKASFGVADPIPAFLRPIRDRAALFAHLNPSDLVQALVIRYDPGAGIGWHRDRPIFEHVIGISLEAPATLRLRRRLTKGFERASIDLARRSIYHLSGAARHDWEHSIADMTVRRWSITFRSFSEKGLREISP